MGCYCFKVAPCGYCESGRVCKICDTEFQLASDSYVGEDFVDAKTGESYSLCAGCIQEGE